MKNVEKDTLTTLANTFHLSSNEAKAMELAINIADKSGYMAGLNGELKKHHISPPTTLLARRGVIEKSGSRGGWKLSKKAMELIKADPITPHAGATSEALEEDEADDVDAVVGEMSDYLKQLEASNGLIVITREMITDIMEILNISRDMFLVAVEKIVRGGSTFAGSNGSALASRENPDPMPMIIFAQDVPPDLLPASLAHLREPEPPGGIAGKESSATAHLPKTLPKLSAKIPASCDLLISLKAALEQEISDSDTRIEAAEKHLEEIKAVRKHKADLLGALIQHEAESTQ